MMSPQAERLAGLLMEEDPLFHTALNEALELTRQDRFPWAVRTSAMPGTILGVRT